MSVIHVFSEEVLLVRFITSEAKFDTSSINAARTPERPGALATELENGSRSSFCWKSRSFRARSVTRKTAGGEAMTTAIFSALSTNTSR